MATVYSVGETQALNSPPERVEQGGRGGRVKCMYDEYTSAGALVNGTVIQMGKLPAGARIVNAIMTTSDHGTAGTCTVGWAANGVEVADADGIFTTVDLNAAALVTSLDEQISAGFGTQFSAETSIQIVITTADTTAAGSFKLAVFYIVD